MEKFGTLIKYGAVAVIFWFLGSFSADLKERNQLKILCQRYAKVTVTDPRDGRKILSTPISCSPSSQYKGKCAPFPEIVHNALGDRKALAVIPGMSNRSAYDAGANIGWLQEIFSDRDGNIITINNIEARPASLSSALLARPIHVGRSEVSFRLTQGAPA